MSDANDEKTGLETDEKTATSTNDASVATENTTPPPLELLPSHSPLVFRNYPSYWSKEDPPRPRPGPSKLQRSENGAGVSLSTLRAVMSTTSSDEEMKRDLRRKERNQPFREEDPSNNHQYLQQPDRSYSKPRLNIFGREIGPMGKPPSLFGGGGFSLGRRKK